MASIDEIVRISGQSHEIMKRVGNGSLDARSVRKALQDIIEGHQSQDARMEAKRKQNDPYQDKLLMLPLDDQLQRLRRYNAQYWENRLTEQEFWVMEQVVTQTRVGHIQRVYDLATFHVQFDSLEETVKMWWRVYVGEQPKHYWPRGEFKFDSGRLRLLDTNVKTYEPGIHRIRIDLRAHWEPVNGRTLEEVREQAKVSNETLAALEVLSAYGLHSELFREQDGENLPYSDMPGTDVSVPGDARTYALYVYWDTFYRRAELYANAVSSRYNEWAAPVLRE